MKCSVLVVTAVLALVACSGGSSNEADREKCGSGTSCATSSTTLGMDSPQAYAYDACQQHSFGGPGLLLDDVKSSAKWPELNSGVVTVSGSGTHFRVVTHVAGTTPLGQRMSWPIDCDTTRRPGNQWTAVSHVGDGVPKS